MGQVPKLSVKRGASVEVRLPVELRSGYHVNSNTPSESYLIPLRLTWDESLLKVESVKYPKPEMEKYPFAEQALSVFTGNFEIATRFTAPKGAASGPNIVTGKLRYQACSNVACLPPRTLDVQLSVVIQ